MIVRISGVWYDTPRNVKIFGVDNSSSSHADNHKKNFLILDKCLTYGINGSLGSPEKKVNINFTQTDTKFCLRLHYNADNSYFLLYLMDLVILSLKKYF